MASYLSDTRVDVTDQFTSPSFVSWDDAFSTSAENEECCKITTCEMFQAIPGCTVGDCYETVANSEAYDDSTHQ